MEQNAIQFTLIKHFAVSHNASGDYDLLAVLSIHCLLGEQRSVKPAPNSLVDVILRLNTLLTHYALGRKKMRN